MTTVSIIKDIVERLKNGIKDLTEFQNSYNDSGTREDHNGVLKNLKEILGDYL